MAANSDSVANHRSRNFRSFFHDDVIPQYRVLNLCIVSDRRCIPRVQAAPVIFQEREADVEVSLKRRKLEPLAFAHVCGNEFTLSDCLRIDVSCRMGKDAARNVIEYARFQNLYSREHERGNVYVI